MMIDIVSQDFFDTRPGKSRRMEISPKTYDDEMLVTVFERFPTVNKILASCSRDRECSGGPFVVSRSTL